MHRGFQLIELMIVIGIISILSAMAYPSFSHHLKTTHRLQAQKQLLELAVKLEQYQMTIGSYENASLPALGVSEFTEGKKYHLTLRINNESYLITATPKVNDECGVLSLNSNGEKFSNSAECWL